MRPALRPMSEARPMTSGEEERTSRRNSRRASRSPASALSETARSSSRRFLVSSEGSSAPGSGSGTSPLSFVSVVAGRYQLGPGEDARRLRELQDRGAEGFQALQLRPLPRLALLPRQAEVGVSVGYKLRFLPGPHVPLADPAVFALGLVVVEVAAAPLPGHPLPRPSCATSRRHPRLCDKCCSKASVPVAGEGFPVESGVAAHHGAGLLARLEPSVYGLPPGPASRWSASANWVSVRFLVNGRSSYRSVVDQIRKPPPRGSLRDGLSCPRVETTAPRPTRPSAGRTARPFGVFSNRARHV